MIKIDVKSRKYNLSLTIHQKMTIIRGDSGVGKSQFTFADADVSGAYKIQLSDNQYHLEVPSDKSWYNTISRNIEHKDKCIYIIDDADYITSKEFAALFMSDHYSFYICINRFSEISPRGLGRFPFSVDEVYSFCSRGNYHYLTPYYPSCDIDYSTAYFKNS